MPRRAQRRAAPQDQGYGVRGEQMAAQAEMPLPQNRAPGGAPSAPAGAPVEDPAAPPGSIGPPPEGGGGDPMAALLAEAAAAPAPPGTLDAPTAFPDEPITAGLDVGEGPGPEALMAPEVNRTAETLSIIAEVTGDPRIMDLARQAGMG
jgi:hypothetical protein